MTISIRTIKCLVLALCLIASFSAKAQTSQLSGTITIPSAPTIEFDFSYFITIDGFDENGFFVLSSANNFASGFFSVGATQAAYTLEIPIEPSITSYRVQLFCTCGNAISTVFFTPNGLTFSGDDPSASIPRNDLPSQINFNVPLGTSISGQILLPNNEVAPRQLTGFVNIVDSNSGFSVNSTFATIEQNSNATNFQVSGLAPVTGIDYQAQFFCSNCELDYLQTSIAEQNIPSGVNINGVDIVLSDDGTIVSGEVSVPNNTVISSLFVDYELVDSGGNFLGLVFGPILGATNENNTIPWAILVPNNPNATDVLISYFCGACDNVLSQGRYNSDIAVFNATADFNNGELIPLGGQGITNINFSLLPDRDGDGIVDPSFTVSPILNLLLDDEE